ncbi:ABC transporter ATP-binding protein [Maricaulis parjimensis]|uniref:ABC transporter ATP-binding protein n=1 Tax=Maricaulis parjimensis TaxID=144023 RepID=UPI001EEDACE2|nr:ABC transporter ATP-binding protein [Maricaulis parjimensis]
MAYVSAENVSLVFPLYSRAQVQGMSSDAPHDDRLILANDGRVLGVKALENISFEAKSGDRLALIGKNGSGKTTLLQVLSGIIPPDEGCVNIRGRSTNLININLGMQVEASGHRNITLRGLAAGQSRDEIERRRQDIAEFSELGEFLDMPIETYSAGMRMRLNFAIATAFDPEILILDEWLSAGDAAFKAKATARMAEFVGKAGVLILASHSRKLLVENCNKAIWLEEGAIRATGDVGELFDAYDAETSRDSR